VPSADERWPFHLDANSAEMLRETLARAGALICGRGLFDLTNGWDDNHPIGARNPGQARNPPAVPRAALRLRCGSEQTTCE
jgi:hypothetical protein